MLKIQRLSGYQVIRQWVSEYQGTRINNFLVFDLSRYPDAWYPAHWFPGNLIPSIS